MRFAIAAALPLLLALSQLAAAATTTTVVDLPVTGGMQRFLYTTPDAPVGHVVVLPGGEGIFGVQNDGTMTLGTGRCNPVARARQRYADAGFAVALADTNPFGGAAELEHVVEMVRWLRARRDVPVWIFGGSSSTGKAAFVASGLAAEAAVGLVLYAPMRMDASVASAVRRPTLVIAHALDTIAFGGAVFASLTAASPKELVLLTGGNRGDCDGYHLFNGLDAEFAAATTGFMSRHAAATLPAEAKYQALWYAAPAESEAGWGVNVTHQGDTLFATWFTYDAAGPLWLVMSNGAKVAPGTWRGTLYRTTGPAFGASPFDPARVAVAEVGSATFEFADESNGRFSYTVNGVSGSKAITRQVFASPVPRCTAGTAPSASNFQDLWWNPAESGWGVNLAHQGDILFGTWFTYGADGKGRWLVMPSLQRMAGAGTRFAGEIYRTTGAPFDAYDRARLTVTAVGTATFDFSGPAAATFAYTLEGVTQTKTITRQVFASPITTCR